VQTSFQQRDLVCEMVGKVQPTSELVLQAGSEKTVFWDLAQQNLTGFAAQPRSTEIGVKL
jgi:hypothetical protein